MIDRRDAVTVFRSFMKPSHQMQVLRLVGGEKMGKTHLLTKVFPALAREEFQAHCAVLDLSRNQNPTVCDFLHSACSQISVQENGNYYTAYREWINRPRKVTLSQLLFLISSLTVSIQDTSRDLHEKDLYLTAQFIKDLGKLNDKPVLLLFNKVHCAEEYVQIWLMDTLLGQLSQLPQIRAVVAGCSLPEANSSYISSCHSYELLPVKEVEHYMEYCRSSCVELSNESIKDFVRAFEYRPGLFVDFVIPAFAPER